MIYLTLDEKGNVFTVSTFKMQGSVAYNGAMPPKPIAEEDTEPRLMLVNGALVWVTGKTEEEIAEERKRAYTEECDPYLVAYQGYLVEGDEAKAESARKAYLKAKAEVRKRLPYAEGDQKSGTRCTCAIDNCLVKEDGTCAEWERPCSLKDAGENTAEE